MRRLALLVGGFTAACLVTVYVFAPPLIFVGIAAGLCVLAYLLRYRFCRRIAILLLGFVIGCAWCIGHRTLFHPADAQLKGSTTYVSATVEGLPSKTAYGWLLEVHLTAPKGGDAELYFQTEPAVLPGDTVRCTVEFPAVAEDAAAVDSSLFGKVLGEHEVISCPDPSPFYRLRRFAAKVRSRLYQLLDKDTAGFYSALVMSDKSGISPALRYAMSQCGTYHMVSLSGMHISLLMGFVSMLCGKRRALSACLGIPLLICFTLFSGAGTATTRAAVMQLLLLLAPLLRREYDSLTALSAALLLLLIKNPWSIASQSLQLSFLATAGIVLFSQRLRERLMPRSLPNRFCFHAVNAVFSGLSLTLSALLFTAPLLLIYFGIVSVLAPVTNLLLLAAITVCFPFALFTALICFLSPALGALLAYPLQWFYRYIVFVSDFFSRLPFCAVYAEAPLLSWGVILAQTILVLGLLLECRRVLAVVSSAAILTTGCLLHFLPPRQDGFTALNVGQGQCLIWQCCGKTVMFDCGGSGDETASSAVQWLLSHRSYAIDVLVLTHFDRDHVDGAARLLSRLPVGEVLIPADAPQCEEKARLLSAAAQNAVTVREVCELTRLSCDGGTVTIFPPMDGDNENNCGLSALASAGNCDILITGDMDIPTEIALARRYDLPDLEVLVAGHHGSAKSTGNALLELLSPELVLISVGQNPYGHPEYSTLKRIEHYGGTAYRTDQNGNLTVRWEPYGATQNG